MLFNLRKCSAGVLFWGAICMGLLLSPAQLCAQDDYLAKLVIPPEIKKYSDAYNIAHNHKNKSVENVFRLGEAGKAAFFASNDSELISSILWDERDNYSSAQKFSQKMAELMPGYYISAGAENLYYEAKPEIFLDLAKKHGDARDIEFFKLYKKSFPRGDSWPSYVEQQTDIQGCVKYGVLAEHYSRWRSFINKYRAGYYHEAAERYLSEAIDRLEYKCSCDSKSESIKGLSAMAAVVTDSAVRKNIESDINNRQNKSSYDNGGRYGYDAKCAR